MDRLIIPILIVLFFTINISIFSAQQKANLIYIETPERSLPIQVDFATTKEEHARGLMFKKELKQGDGMLFVYEKPGTPFFWMKNMLISLDMLFIGEDLKIKKIFHQVPPCETEKNCPTYSHPEKIKYVLEIPSGYAKANGIEVGQSLRLN